MKVALLCVGITLGPALFYWGVAHLVFAVEDWMIRRRMRRTDPPDSRLTQVFNPYEKDHW